MEYGCNPPRLRFFGADIFTKFLFLAPNVDSTYASPQQRTRNTKLKYYFQSNLEDVPNAQRVWTALYLDRIACDGVTKGCKDWSKKWRYGPERVWALNLIIIAVHFCDPDFFHALHLTCFFTISKCLTKTPGKLCKKLDCSSCTRGRLTLLSVIQLIFLRT